MTANDIFVIVMMVLLIFGPLGVMKHVKDEYGMPMFANMGFGTAILAMIYSFLTVFRMEDSGEYSSQDLAPYYLGLVLLLALSALINKKRLGIGYVGAIGLAIAQYLAASTMIALFVFLFLLFAGRRD